jgi:aldehyde dehydrogenase (NAD+)
MPETIPTTANLCSNTLKERIDHVFDAQQKNKRVIRQSSAKTRIGKLKKIEDWILNNRQKIRDAVYADFKKPEPEVDLEEIYASLIELRYARQHLRRWMRPKKAVRTRQMLITRSRILYESKGNVLIISPWNFPFMLSVSPLISAISAGNCVILKPSEISPNTCRLLNDMVTELFPENEVAVINGDKEVATELLKKPFDHIFFTGSSYIGKIVMKAAAENLSSVTLELGGKSPVIVDETANLADAVKKIAWGKYMNSGQTCVAPDYLFVHQNSHGKFMELLKKEIALVYGNSEADREKSPDFARIVDQKHYTRLKDLLSEAVQTGSSLDAGNIPENGDKYIPPSIVLQVNPNTGLMKEEIFGPVLPVITYESLSEVLDIINNHQHPLAVYIFSNNRENINHIIANTRSGGVVINDVVIQFLHSGLPFGGLRDSGFGNSHGFYGFRAFSHERAILKSTRFSPFKFLYAPYPGWKRRLIDFLIRHF